MVFLGPPGVGKTHLAVSLAVAASEGGRRGYYATLADLITSLEDAQQAGRLSHRLRLERKGQGLVIADGEHQVKASRVARDLSLRYRLSADMT